MKRFNVSTALFAMLFLGFVAFGCNENDDPITPGTNAPAAPTGLRATAKSATEIILKWNAPAATPQTAGYELTVTPGGATPIQITTGTVTTLTVGSLTEGTEYTFSLKAKGTDGKASAAATVKWAPAKRSGVLRLYSSKSTTFGSGLDLSNAGGVPEVLKIDEGGKWDIAFDDKNLDSIAIGSPYESRYIVDATLKFPNGNTPKKTLVSTLRYSNASSLDDIFESTMLDAGTRERMQLLNTTNGFAFVVKTEEGNYAKILVLANGGKIIQGSGNDTYIEVQVSYQSTPNVPYALPGQVRPANVVETGTVTQRSAR